MGGKKKKTSWGKTNPGFFRILHRKNRFFFWFVLKMLNSKKEIVGKGKRDKGIRFQRRK